MRPSHLAQANCSAYQPGTLEHLQRRRRHQRWSTPSSPTHWRLPNRQQIRQDYRITKLSKKRSPPRQLLVPKIGLRRSPAAPEGIGPSAFTAGDGPSITAHVMSVQAGRASATAARSLKGGGFVPSTGREGLMTLLECRRAAVARARPAIRPVESALAAIGFATLTRSGSSNRIA